MSHEVIRPSERHLTPAEVEVLDRRRRRGQLLLVLGLQTLVVTLLVGVLWAGQDVVQSPGWTHPMLYWCMFTGFISLVSFISGIRLRRGFHEFTSY
jgi:hypothetical protein